MLRNYVCPNCKRSGDDAHTLKHCPITIRENKMRKILAHLNDAMVERSTNYETDEILYDQNNEPGNHRVSLYAN